MTIFSRTKLLGFTMLELAVVLLVLAALAAVVMPYVIGTTPYAACKATDATLHRIKSAIVGDEYGGGFYHDMMPARLPDNNGDGVYSLHYLFAQENNPDFNPSISAGWRGPYLRSWTVESGEFTVQDAHWRKIELQVPTDQQQARIVSKGANGILELLATDAPSANRGDDQVVFLFIPDPLGRQTCD